MSLCVLSSLLLRPAVAPDAGIEEAAGALAVPEDAAGAAASEILLRVLLTLVALS